MGKSPLSNNVFRDVMRNTGIGLGIGIYAVASFLIGNFNARPKIDEVKNSRGKIEYIIADTDAIFDNHKDVFFPQPDGSYMRAEVHTSKIGNLEMRYVFDSNGQAYVFNGKDYNPATPEISKFLSKGF